MTGLSTHVLDAVEGAPAVGMRVTLYDADNSELASAATDDDGRVGDILTSPLVAGTYRLHFDTGAWFASIDTATFYPEVSISFVVTDPDAHHHVPLLLSPFAYSTYRGS